MDPNQTGAPLSLPQQLQQLLLSRIHTPEQMQQKERARQGALESYQASLRQNPYGNYTPTEHAAYQWIGNMGKGNPSGALTSGVGAGGEMLGQIQQGLHAGNAAAAKVGYDDAVTQAKFDTNELSALKTLSGGTRAANEERLGKSYQIAMNVAAQMAKQKQFPPTPEGTEQERQYVIETANMLVENQINRYWTGDKTGLPAWLGGTDESAIAGPGQPAQAQPQIMPSKANPGVEAALLQQGVGGSLPPVVPNTSVGVQRPNIAREADVKAFANMDETRDLPDQRASPEILAKELQEAQAQLAVAKNPLEKKYLNEAIQRIQGKLAGGIDSAGMPAEPAEVPKRSGSVAPGRLAPLPPIALPPQIDKPQQAYDISANKEMGQVEVEAYKTLQAKQPAVQEKIQALNNLEKLQLNTGKLADMQSEVGQWFSALGQDPNDPKLQEAFKIRDANLILAQLRNALLRAEKGQQTKGDEVRIANELPKTTDANQIFRYGVALAKESAQREQDQMEFFNGVVNNPANKGAPRNATNLWSRNIKDDPLTQEIGGTLVFRSQYIRDFLEANPKATKDIAVSRWKAKEQEWLKRNPGAR